MGKKVKSDIMHEVVSMDALVESKPKVRKIVKSKDKDTQKKIKPVKSAEKPNNKPKSVKVEKRLVFHLHLPRAAYVKLKEASERCGVSMQEFARRAIGASIFDMP
jgi:hypothetical protein